MVSIRRTNNLKRSSANGDEGCDNVVEAGHGGGGGRPALREKEEV